MSSKSMPGVMEAVIFEAPGQSQEVLRVAQVPVPRPQPGEVLVSVQARPVSPADLMFIGGRYRLKPVFPQVAGLEGCGEVTLCGQGVDIAPGSRVAFRHVGTWADYVCVPAAKLHIVPAGVAVESASQFSLNPITAWGLLDEAGAKAGDWIAINAATSGVARVVAGLARSRGIKIVGVVRGEPAFTGAFPCVSIAAEDLAAEIMKRTGGAQIGALLDSVGGTAITRTISAMKQGATIVSYGVLETTPSQIGNPDMIYRNLCWKGFGIDYWLSRSTDRHAVMAVALWQAIAAGEIELPVKSRHPLRDVQQAVVQATTGANTGKVLLAQ